MPVAEQVKSLTEDIKVSHGTRTTTISDIEKEAHKRLEDFHRERIEKTRDLRQFLADSRRELAERTREMKHTRVSTRSELTNEVQEIRAENNKEFQEQTHETEEFLANAETERKEDFNTLIDEIRTTVAAIEKEADDTVVQFHNEHQEMAEQLRKNLRETVDSLMDEFSSDRRQSLNHWATLSRNRRAPMPAKPAGRRA